VVEVKLELETTADSEERTARLRIRKWSCSEYVSRSLLGYGRNPWRRLHRVCRSNFLFYEDIWAGALFYSATTSKIVLVALFLGWRGEGGTLLPRPVFALASCFGLSLHTSYPTVNLLIHSLLHAISLADIP